MAVAFAPGAVPEGLGGLHAPTPAGALPWGAQGLWRGAGAHGPHGICGHFAGAEEALGAGSLRRLAFLFGARSELSKRPAGLTAAELLRSEQLESAGSGALLETLAQQTAFLELSLHGATAEDTKLVRSTLAESFGNVSRALKASTEALDSFGLTQGQLEALLSAVRHMADQRVQDIGATVSAALASYFKVEGADAGKEAARQRAYGEKEME